MVNHKKEVIKHSAAIQIENRITLLQRRTWNVLLANAYDELPTEEKHAINVADLTETLGYESRNDKHLKDSLKTLVRSDVVWNVLDKDGRWEWGVTTLLAEAKIKNGVCTYAYGPTLRERLYNPNMYARISLSLQNKFDRKHALALYELFVDYLHVDKNYGETPFISIENFRKLMGIPDDMHQQFKMLNHRVIKEPIEEINSKTDFKVNVEYKKRGRKVVAVKFKIRRVLQIPKRTASQREPLTDEIALPDIVTELMQAGVTRTKSIEIWRQQFECVNPENRPEGVDFDDYIREKIDLLESQPKGSLKNRAGYLLRAIEENYINEKFVARQQEKAKETRRQKIAELQQRKDAFDKERSEVCEGIFQQIIDQTPHIVEKILQEMVQNEPTLGHWYAPDKTPNDNYGKMMLQVPLRKQLREKDPDRFREIDQVYQEKIDAIEEEIAALKAAGK